jgi:hypothetical protein
MSRFIKDLSGNSSLTLDGTPDEVQDDSLQQGDVTSTKAPGKPILHSKTNVPTKSTPGDQCREECDQKFSNHNHHQTLTHQSPYANKEIQPTVTRMTRKVLHGKVFGVCQFEMFRELSVQYPK